MQEMQSDKRLLRTKVTRAIRDFFHQEGFVETETPTLVLSPGMEPHIRPVKVEGGAFLHTSPEFAMKRILARGYGKIFQVCKTYRLEPKSVTHHPEFTMLEWYRSRADYKAIMDDVESLFEAIALAVHGSTKFSTPAYGSQDVSRPWKRLTVEEAFREFAGLELRELLSVEALAKACVEKGFASRDTLAPVALKEPGLWDDLFFRVMLNAVEPGLAKLGRPVILYRYPESQAALSNLERDADGTIWAKRFEVYAGGLELGNAFDELIDAKAQRARFEKDMALRERIYGPEFPANPIDEDFLAALSDMPASGGIAMGVDRLAMYFTGASDIREVLWQDACWNS